jgi:hypothetical protein
MFQRNLLPPPSLLIGSRFFQIVGIYPSNYVVWYSRRPQLNTNLNETLNKTNLKILTRKPKFLPIFGVVLKRGTLLRLSERNTLNLRRISEKFGTQQNEKRLGFCSTTTYCSYVMECKRLQWTETWFEYRNTRTYSILVGKPI